MKHHYPSGATKRREREMVKSKTDALPKLTGCFNVSMSPVDPNVIMSWRRRTRFLDIR